MSSSATSTAFGIVSIVWVVKRWKVIFVLIMRTLLWSGGGEADQRHATRMLRRGVTKVTRKRTAGDIQAGFFLKQNIFKRRAWA